MPSDGRIWQWLPYLYYICTHVYTATHAYTWYTYPNTHTHRNTHTWHTYTHTGYTQIHGTHTHSVHTHMVYTQNIVHIYCICLHKHHEHLCWDISKPYCGYLHNQKTTKTICHQGKIAALMAITWEHLQINILYTKGTSNNITKK